MKKMADKVPSFMMASQLRKSCQLSEKTRVFVRGDENHKPNAYQECSSVNFLKTQLSLQYAKTSHSEMSPEAIIYPENLQEILNIVDYAKGAKIGIAVRTGGHQYSGIKAIFKRLNYMQVNFRSLLNNRNQHTD